MILHFTIIFSRNNLYNPIHQLKSVRRKQHQISSKLYLAYTHNQFFLERANRNEKTKQISTSPFQY